MKIYCTTDKQTYEAPLEGKSGNVSAICPACNATRKNKGAKSFSFDMSKGAGMCHNCDRSFVTAKEFKVEYEKKEYVRPRKFENNTVLSDATLKYFESRRISAQTVKEMLITESIEYMPQEQKEVRCINFNYFRGEELVNVKYRDAKKNFKMFSGAELIPYNLNAVSESCIWCEGEFDQLSYYEAGFKFAVSVPNGASRSKQNLVYIDNAINELECVKTHYISTDNDEPGIALKDELIRRFGAENCKIIDLGDCKDANEFLVKYGKISLVEAVSKAKDIPLSGIYSIDKDIDELIDLWKNGMPKGLSLMHEKTNQLVTWVSGALAIWTGIPSAGKSEMVDEICEQLNIMYGWKTAYFSPENWPTKLHVAKVVSRVSGRRFSQSCIGEYELGQTLAYVRENFFFIEPDDEDLSVEAILAHAKSLIKRYGIKQLVIDPWNKLEHRMQKGESETAYICRVLDVLDVFAKRNDILIHLVAHPRKMQKDASGNMEVPNLYDISGSAHFYNKAFYGLCVHRKDELVELYILKVKFKHLGQPKGGVVQFRYNINNGRYVEVEDCQTGINWDNNSHLDIPGLEQMPVNDNFENTPF